MTTIPSTYASEFTAAGHAYNIPPWVLAGVAQVESAMGTNRGPSSTGAIGLMQFEPATASGLGINPYNDHDAIWGAAKLLNQYGYQTDPTHALSSYNAGPAADPAARAQGNAYARNVLAAGAILGPQLGTSTAPSPAAAASPATSAPAPTTASAPSSGTSKATVKDTLTGLLLKVVLVGAGGVLAAVGARSALSPRPQGATR